MTLKTWGQGGGKAHVIKILTINLTIMPQAPTYSYNMVPAVSGSLIYWITPGPTC